MPIPHIHSMSDVYTVVGSLVVGWVLNSVWGWLKHCFWLGFKANFVASVKKGAPLTDEERAAIKAKVAAQIQGEWNAKMKKLVGVLDDEPTPPQAGDSANPA